MQDNTEALAEHYRQLGIEVTFELNPGNHFQDVGAQKRKRNDSNMIIKEINTKSVITKTDLPVCDYAVNPHVGCTHGCKYCYASFMKRFTNHPEPWGEFLDVKYWPEIRKPEKYAGKELFFGTVTDPYNPQEEQYRRTRSLLEQLQGSGVKITLKRSLTWFCGI